MRVCTILLINYHYHHKMFAQSSTLHVHFGYSQWMCMWMLILRVFLTISLEYWIWLLFLRLNSTKKIFGRAGSVVNRMNPARGKYSYHNNWIRSDGNEWSCFRKWNSDLWTLKLNSVNFNLVKCSNRFESVPFCWCILFGRLIWATIGDLQSDHKSS